MSIHLDPTKININQINNDQKTIALDIGTGHSDQILDDTQLQADTIILIGTADAPFNVILNTTVPKSYTIENNSGQTATVKNNTGLTAILVTGSLGVFVNDGTNVSKLSTGGGGSTTEIDVEIDQSVPTQFTTLHDFFDGPVIRKSKFDRDHNIFDVSNSNFTLLPSSSITGLSSLVVDVFSGFNNLAGYRPFAVELGIGEFGSGSTTIATIGIFDEVPDSPINLVDIRNSYTHKEILSGGYNRVYGLIQASNGTLNGDFIGDTGSENLQISFVTKGTYGLQLATINESVQISFNLVTDRRLAFLEFIDDSRDSEIIPSISLLDSDIFIKRTFNPINSLVLSLSSDNFSLLTSSLLTTDGSVIIYPDFVSSHPIGFTGISSERISGFGAASLTNLDTYLSINNKNVVDIRYNITNREVLYLGKRVYGLIQANSTVVDGDAIGDTGSENLQITFVTIKDGSPNAANSFELAYVTGDIQISTNFAASFSSIGNVNVVDNRDMQIIKDRTLISGISGALSSGAVTVSTSLVHSDSIISISHNTASGTMGHLSIGTIVDSTSFDILTDNILDLSTVNWAILNWDVSNPA